MSKGQLVSRFEMFCTNSVSTRGWPVLAVYDTLKPCPTLYVSQMTEHVLYVETAAKVLKSVRFEPNDPAITIS